jgi:hypothetical protein
MQGDGSVADLARQFREEVHSVLFGCARSGQGSTPPARRW